MRVKPRLEVLPPLSSDVLNANSITAGFHQDEAEIWRQIADLELWGSEPSETAPASTKSENARFGEFQVGLQLNLVPW